MGPHRPAVTTLDQHRLTMPPSQPNKPTPPRWLDQLLERFCAPHLLEEVLGDLHERYALNVQRVGETKARRRYGWEVLAYLRPAVIKRRSFQHNKPIPMFSNYFQSAYRSLTKHIGYTIINIIGLAIGLTASLFIALYIFQELSYDRYHTKADRIYRVETQKINPEGTSAYAGAPLGVATALRNDFSEVAQVATIVFYHNQLVDVPSDQTRFKESIAFTEPSLFSIFDYQWLVGDPQTALKEPNEVLLTERYARKFFGGVSDTDFSEVLGKVIQINREQNLRITGVLRDHPTLTSFPFDLIASLSTLKDLDRNGWGGWSDNDQTYILLAEGTYANELQSQFPKMLEKYKGEGASQEKGHQLVPLSEVHYNYNYSGQGGNRGTLYALGLIGLFLLTTACINFINLATAQASKRAKEVGVRKVLGSSRSQLIGQMMSETFLVTLSAFVVALAMVVLLLPVASALMEVDLSATSALHPTFILFALGLLFTVSILAGWYPAWVLSGFRPVTALKSKMTHRQKSGFSLRQGMVTLQFIISQVLIIGTVVVTSQIHLFRDADLGFDKEAIITVSLPNQQPEKLQRLRNQLLQFPEIRNVSFSANSASAESNYMRELVYKTGDREISIRAQSKLADDHFLDTYGIALLAGETLQERDTTGQVIINEVLAQKMGFLHPQEAIGAYIDEVDRKLLVQGVAHNFHVNSLHQNIDPTIIEISPQHYYQASIKMQNGSNIRQTIQDIQDAWTVAFPEQLFGYQFLNETLAQAYEQENQAMRLLNTFAVIAIFISCLGLYGLVSFVAAQRTKEVGIRKIFGASVNHIVRLFSQEFIKLVLFAFVIATPISYYLVNQWLQDFAYRIDIQWWMFAAAGILVLLIALLTVSFQSIKAALANPVDSLRNE